MPFGGLRDADFAAYAPTKWRSNVYNRERLETKERLLDLAREAGGHLRDTMGAPLAAEASIEYPALSNRKQVDAQHVFFSRNEAARRDLDRIIDRARGVRAMLDDPTPQRTHVFLVVTLREAGLDVALRLHGDAIVDRKNLERKCEDPERRASLFALLDSLVGVAGASELRDALAAHQVAEVALTHHLGRDQAVALGAGLVGPVGRALDALASVYQFIAWTPSNDFASIREGIARERAALRTRGFARADRVRIVRGLLSGQQGIVQDIDAKGELRLLVGTVAIKISTQDVAPLPRG